MKLSDAKGHLTGQSIYTDDIPEVRGTLYVKAVQSPVAHARITHINTKLAELIEGVTAVLTHKDIRGENQIGLIIQDEPLLAEDELHRIGQPYALVVAETKAAAEKGAKAVEIEYRELPAVTDARDAAAKGLYIAPPRTFAQGDIETGKKSVKYYSEGRVISGGQEHLYLETQGAYTIPQENGQLKVYSSTQGPTAVQTVISKVTGLAMHQIEVDVNRLGGGFGGKEDQASHWAAFTAIAAQKTGKAVKYIAERPEDMAMTGKRHPYDSDFKIGLDKDFRIVYYEADFYQNAGSAADLSPAISERTLFHGVGSYFIPNTRYTVYSCKTNLPPNTAFRGFGAPQAFFVIESAIQQIAEEIGTEAETIKKINLLKDGDSFPYGQIAEDAEGLRSWNLADKKFDFKKLKQKVENFNNTHTHKKQGYAITPICFGISFTNTSMNQARALVHIYQDGSIGISTGAIEMGQGVNTKMKQIAADIFSVKPERVKLETTNTTRVANTSPTAASSGSDLNGKALEKACIALRERLTETAYALLTKGNGPDPENIELKDEIILRSGKPTELNWEELIKAAYFRRIALTENAHYATPKIHFDKSKEKGRPFTYHVYGTAFTIAEIDTLRGSYDVKSVKIVHDFGKSMNTDIDNGQVEGALMQGIGWLTLEEPAYDNKGRLLAGALSTYKVPDIYAAPKEVLIEHLPSEGHEAAAMRSKAIGEPPFLYGLGSFFAIRDAAKAFNPELQKGFVAPLTPERLLLSLYE